MKRNKKGQFIKVANENTYRGFGIWYDTKGYPTIWINNKSIKLHVYVWEREHGEKPDGMQLHHKNFNKKTYSIDNLELLTQSDHQKIHAGWVRNAKKEWVLKPCKTCKEKLPLNMFYQRKGLTPSNHCKKCSSINHRKKLKQDFNYREKRRLYLKEYYYKNKDKILEQQKKKRKGVASE